MFYIWHNNLMLSLSPDDFFNFKNIIENTSFDETSMPFPDKKERVLLPTPDQDISFAFTNEELKSFRTLLNEAVFMKEVYSLMGTEPGTNR
ncbi:hypothetical protein TH53_06025 [Pedobacter lusitanus]|uniref:Contig25, whole genome shotgun sequence n=1 Tax=Pedobacter lusitanus TaxID=1503925 RepID=A0A0D0GLD6_9SPHI|nr:hypothetical protein TH53_06025 [Pedobacter lusitanus]